MPPRLRLRESTLSPPERQSRGDAVSCSPRRMFTPRNFDASARTRTSAEANRLKDQISAERQHLRTSHSRAIFRGIGSAYISFLPSRDGLGRAAVLRPQPTSMAHSLDGARPHAGRSVLGMIICVHELSLSLSLPSLSLPPLRSLQNSRLFLILLYSSIRTHTHTHTHTHRDTHTSE